jgi:hypothetical protein
MKSNKDTRGEASDLTGRARARVLDSLVFGAHLPVLDTEEDRSTTMGWPPCVGVGGRDADSGWTRSACVRGGVFEFAGGRIRFSLTLCDL